MSDERIVRYTLATLPPGEVDWARINAMTEEDLERAIAEDPDSNPPMPPEWFQATGSVMDPADCDTWLRLDDDIAAAFKDRGNDWRARVNEILRAHIARKDAAE